MQSKPEQVAKCDVAGGAGGPRLLGGVGMAWQWVTPQYPQRVWSEYRRASGRCPCLRFHTLQLTPGTSS